MLDDVAMPAAPMAAIPTMAADQSGISNGGTNNNPDDIFSHQQGPLDHQQQPPISHLTDQEIRAMLTANSATPPPFETVNPSALNSPAPLTDFSSAEQTTTNTPSPCPFQPNNFPLFADQHTSLPCSPIVGMPQQHQPYTIIGPDSSPALSTLSEPPHGFLASLPTVDGVNGVPFPQYQDPQHPPQDKNHIRDPALVRAHSQPPEDVGLPAHPHPHHRLHRQVLGQTHHFQQQQQQYASIPTTAPGPHSPFRPQPHAHHMHRAASSSSSPPPAPAPVVTFQRSSGHYLGAPEIPRHHFPEAAAPPPHHHAAPAPAAHPNPQAYHQHAGGPIAHQRNRSAGRQEQGGSDWRAGNRQHPYGVVQQQQMRRGGGASRGARAAGPTSAPSPMLVARQRRAEEPVGGAAGEVQGGDAGGPLRFATRSEASTLVLGVQGYVDRLRRECDGMSEFVRSGYEEERGRGGAGMELERRRLEKRNMNSDVTELDEILEPLPRSVQLESGLEDIPWDVPPNGRDIRNLEQASMTTLLEVYNIPFQPDMFLGQKKELYLRFIGANRALMHRVLD